jgi:hypothetical protein
MSNDRGKANFTVMQIDSEGKPANKEQGLAYDHSYTNYELPYQPNMRDIAKDDKDEFEVLKGISDLSEAVEVVTKSTLFGKPESEVIEHPGAFKAKAEAAGMSTEAYAHSVLSGDSKADGKTRKQASLALTLMGMHHKSAAQIEMKTGGTQTYGGAAKLIARKFERGASKIAGRPKSEFLYDYRNHAYNRDVNRKQKFYPEGTTAQERTASYNKKRGEDRTDLAIIDDMVAGKSDSYGRPIGAKEFNDFEVKELDSGLIVKSSAEHYTREPKAPSRVAISPKKLTEYRANRMGKQVGREIDQNWNKEAVPPIADKTRAVIEDLKKPTVLVQEARMGVKNLPLARRANLPLRVGASLLGGAAAIGLAHHALKGKPKPAETKGFELEIKGKPLTGSVHGGGSIPPSFNVPGSSLTGGATGDSGGGTTPTESPTNFANSAPVASATPLPEDTEIKGIGEIAQEGGKVFMRVADDVVPAVIRRASGSSKEEKTVRKELVIKRLNPSKVNKWRRTASVAPKSLPTDEKNILFTPVSDVYNKAKQKVGQVSQDVKSTMQQNKDAFVLTGDSYNRKYRPSNKAIPKPSAPVTPPSKPVATPAEDTESGLSKAVRYGKYGAAGAAGLGAGYLLTRPTEETKGLEEGIEIKELSPKEISDLSSRYPEVREGLAQHDKMMGHLKQAQDQAKFKDASYKKAIKAGKEEIGKLSKYKTAVKIGAPLAAAGIAGSYLLGRRNAETKGFDEEIEEKSVGTHLLAGGAGLITGLYLSKSPEKKEEIVIESPGRHKEESVRIKPVKMEKINNRNR